MKTRKFLTIVSLVLVAVVLGLAACSQASPTPAAPKSTAPAATSAAPKPSAPATTAAPKPAAKLPTMIAISSYGVGAGGYVMATSLGQAVKEKAGISMKVVPGDSDVARVLPLRTGEVQFTMLSGATSFGATHGLDVFGAEEWGPQALRTVWAGITLASPAARADAGIKTLADLKGKRLFRSPGAYFVESLHGAYLAFANLTWKDVQVVTVSGYTAGDQAMIEGNCDAGVLATDSAQAVELQAKRGIAWLPMPAADKEGWKRAWAFAPYIYPRTMTTGIGMSADKPYEGSQYPYGIWTYDKQDPELVYVVTKAIWESYDKYAPTYALLKLWTQDQMVAYKALSYPYHDGTVKFLKDVGKWTPDMDAWQKKQVDLEQARIKAYAEAKVAAKAQKPPISYSTEAWYGINGFWDKYMQEKNLISTPQF